MGEKGGSEMKHSTNQRIGHSGELKFHDTKLRDRYREKGGVWLLLLLSS